uniref:Integrin subunit alpha X n=1 Tax=Aotus nancymaae TaxID=37293 RepID=A0A2K5C0D3_AOTNA
MTRTRAALLLFTALATSLGFNLDTEQPTAFRVDSAGFGDSVVQYANSWVVVGAPHEMTAANQTGGLYQCSYITGSCQPIGLQVPPEAVNMSLGLSLVATTSPSQLLEAPAGRRGDPGPRGLGGFEELTCIQLGVQWARDTLARVDQKEGLWKKSYRVVQWF